MATEPNGNCFIFVIDTDKYAGNFERDMCAYITGQIGECEVGEDFGRIADKEILAKNREWFESFILPVSDEHGCPRPTSIWPTPGWFNDGMGNNHRDGAPMKMVEGLYKKTMKAYNAQYQSKTPIGHASKCPAYNSVAIFLQDRPPAHIVKLMVERALKFPTLNPRFYRPWEQNHKIKIEGFRVLQRVIVDNDITKAFSKEVGHGRVKR